MKPSGKRPSLPFLDRRRAKPNGGFNPREPGQPGQVSHERHVAPPADRLVCRWPTGRCAIVQRSVVHRVGSARGPLEQCRPERQHPLTRATGRFREDNMTFGISRVSSSSPRFVSRTCKFKFFNMNRGITIICYKLFTKNNSILKIITSPRHKCN